MSEPTRRDFMKIAGWAAAVTGFSATAIPVVAYFYPKKLEEVPSEPVAVCPASELQEGEAKTIPFGRYPALVINTGDGLRAYSAVCTHFACICKWNPQTGQIECPCHDGFFEAENGDVISGPPPRGLDKLSATVSDDGTIYVSVPEGDSA